MVLVGWILGRRRRRNAANVGHDPSCVREGRQICDKRRLPTDRNCPAAHSSARHGQLCSLSDLNCPCFLQRVGGGPFSSVDTGARRTPARSGHPGTAPGRRALSRCDLALTHSRSTPSPSSRGLPGRPRGPATASTRARRSPGVRPDRRPEPPHRGDSLEDLSCPGRDDRCHGARPKVPPTARAPAPRRCPPTHRRHRPPRPAPHHSRPHPSRPHPTSSTQPHSSARSTKHKCCTSYRARGRQAGDHTLRSRAAPTRPPSPSGAPPHRTNTRLAGHEVEMDGYAFPPHARRLRA